MYLERLRKALTTPPFLARRDTPTVRGHGDSVPGATHCLMLFGHVDSAMSGSQLEALREAVTGRADRMRGVVIGRPFGAVERTLNAAGFNTAEHLHSFHAAKRSLRFVEPATKTQWHMSESEFTRVDREQTPAAGRSYPIPKEVRFNDWLPEYGNRMTHRFTQRVLPRPERLVFESAFEVAGRRAYDGLATSASPEAFMERLHRLHPVIGLNARMFIKGLVTLIAASGKPVTTTTLHHLVHDADARFAMLEYVAANLDGNAEESATRSLKEAVSTVWESHLNPPKMALDIADELHGETGCEGDLVPAEDLLIPGTIWHIDTTTPAGRYTAHCVKEDLQRLALTAPAGDDITLIFASEWGEVANPALDAHSLKRADIFQCYATAKGRTLSRELGPLGLAVIRGCPRKHWHITTDEGDLALFAELHPDAASQHLNPALLRVDTRLEMTANSARETKIDPDSAGLDGIAANGPRKQRTAGRSDFAKSWNSGFKAAGA